jgi:sialic acid synthase SpsE
MKTYVIAEIAQGFEGHLSYCRDFVKLAQACGADAVKFQIFKADEIALPDYKYYSLFRSLEMPSEDWAKVIELARDSGIDFLADVYGSYSLKWLLEQGVKGFKIHSTDVRNYELLRQVRDKELKVFLATGGSTLEEIGKAIELLGKNTVILLSGFQAEPNTLEDIELEKISQLIQRFGLPVGYADHIDANDPLAVSLPAMAALKSASVIEKHLTIERNRLKLEDYVSALEPAEFTAMVDLIRKVERFVHHDTYALSDRENEYRKRTKKCVLAREAIAKGTVLGPEHLVMLRTGQPVPKLLDYDELVGKKTKVAIAKHFVICIEDLE